MKKFFLIVLVIAVVGGVGYFFITKGMEHQKEEEIKDGWYIEINHKEPIRVRDDHSTKGKEIGKVNTGEIYKVLDVYLEDKSYYWYNIEFEKTTGWVASLKKSPWVKDYNNPIDIAVPIIKFKDNIYKVASIKDINYRHLEVIEDSDDYTITHQIYHEVKPSEFIDQYWIVYTITDKAGKSSSKTQKIEFDVKPDESEVLDFNLYKK